VTDVLITGAGRGIGYALTCEYLRRGARVVAGVRDPGRATPLHALDSDDIEVVPLDVRSQADIDAAAWSVMSVRR
jgi:NAD(P)-dependent dehydrogenase (short-subunit alcohol dehydrogenase family)